MNDVLPLKATKAITLPSGETATDVICQLELRAYDVRARRSRRISPPLRTQRPNFPLIAILEVFPSHPSHRNFQALTSPAVCPPIPRTRHATHASSCPAAGSSASPPEFRTASRTRQ